MAVADRIETDHETLTFLYEDTEDGWVAVRVAEVPAAISQGRTRAEARANAIAALHDLTHEPTLPERAMYNARSVLGRR